MCWCDSCRKPLWGVVRQGLQCTGAPAPAAPLTRAACGYNTHRMCQDLVPFCQPKTIAVAPASIRPALPGNCTCPVPRVSLYSLLSHSRGRVLSVW